MPIKKHQKTKDEFDFESPERELFLWAILFNRSRLVRLFWKQGRDHIGNYVLFLILCMRACLCTHFLCVKIKHKYCRCMHTCLFYFRKVKLEFGGLKRLSRVTIELS